MVRRMNHSPFLANLLLINFSASTAKKLDVDTTTSGIHHIAGKGSVLKGLIPNNGPE